VVAIFCSLFKGESEFEGVQDKDVQQIFSTVEDRTLSSVVQNGFGPQLRAGFSAILPLNIYSSCLRIVTFSLAIEQPGGLRKNVSGWGNGSQIGASHPAVCGPWE
jgi:hypothetical protein